MLTYNTFMFITHKKFLSGAHDTLDSGTLRDAMLSYILLSIFHPFEMTHSDKNFERKSHLLSSHCQGHTDT